MQPLRAEDIPPTADFIHGCAVIWMRWRASLHGGNAVRLLHHVCEANASFEADDLMIGLDDISQQVADEIQGLRLDLFTIVWYNKLT